MATAAMLQAEVSRLKAESNQEHASRGVLLGELIDSKRELDRMKFSLQAILRMNPYDWDNQDAAYEQVHSEARKGLASQLELRGFDWDTQ